MAYVTVPKDLTKIKSKVMFNPIFQKTIPNTLMTVMKALLSGWNSMHRILQKLI